jgi:hypothetical protein
MIVRRIPALLASLLALAPLSPGFARLAPAPSAVAAPPSPTHLYSPPLSFEPNRGQVDRRVRFLTHGGAATVFLTPAAAVISVHLPTAAQRALSPGGRRLGLSPLSMSAPGKSQSSVRVVRLSFVGASPKARLSGTDRLPGTVNYLVGGDPRRWHTNIPTYAGVVEHGLYPGVDLVYRGAGSRLEFGWTVWPGADAGRVRFRIEGAAGLRIDSQGRLEMRVGKSTLIESKPSLYQALATGRRAVGGGFVLLGNGEVGLRTVTYNRRVPLVVDPVLSYGTYLGGSSSEQGLAIATDTKGDAYVAGSTTSTDFPTDKAFQRQNLGDLNVFVGKFNAAGTAFIYSTYIGGSRSDEGLAIAVDKSGSAYVTGDTSSDDYPTAHPLQGRNRSQCLFEGGRTPCPNGFVTKLNPAGDALVYSTYLGGNLEDQGYGIALGSDGSAYVTGLTYSTNFPTLRPLQAHKSSHLCPDDTGRLVACSDAFISKINPAGTALVYSTYFGGDRNVEGNGIAVDKNGSAYICGDTDATSLPAVHAAHSRLTGLQNAFAAALNPAGSALLYSTYLGGKRQDMCTNVAVRHQTAYLTGYTWSSDFPTTAGAFERTRHGLDAFVTAIRHDGVIAFSTLLGGTGDDEAMDVAVDAHDDVWVVGDTTSTDFPVKNAAQPRNAGQTDAFISELDPSGSGLVMSTYLGGSNVDFGHAIALDSAANAYVIGFTYSTDFPTVHSLQGPSGDEDAFVGRLGDRSLVHRRKHG